MIKKIKQTLNSFETRGGFHIFFSTIFLRIVQVVLSVLIIRLLSKEEYGNLSYAFSITQLILPFSGAGLYISLLHFGSIHNGKDQQNQLFSYTLNRGFIYSALIVVLILLL